MLLVFGASATHARVERDPHAIPDPFERVNRKVFKFNDALDMYILSPVARGYRKVTNQSVRTSVRSAFLNLREPMSAANHLLQLKPKDSAISVGRFAVNTTLGLGGLFDVASGWGWKNDLVGFDRTMAYWCVPDGPYLVIPFVGPGTPRSALGETADYFSHPMYWATRDIRYPEKLYVSGAFSGARAVVSREALLDLTDDFRRTSVDYYATMRAAFMQNRSRFNCHPRRASSTTPNYDFDFVVDY
jgi:phospholipid-binding lipoprotein MlaA